jgi:hypothetical protein
MKKNNNSAEFTAIIEPREILESQKKLEKKVKSELTFIGTRRVGFPGGHDDFEIWANDRIWYGTQVVPDNIPHSRTRRVWNGFGLYGQLADAQPNKLNITMEVNIPFELNRRISGASGGVKMHQNRRDKNVWFF